MAEQVVGPRPVADPLPLPAAVLRPGRSMRFARGGRALEKLAGRQPGRQRERAPRRWRTVTAGRTRGPTAPPRTSRGCASARPALVREVAQQALLFPATRAFTMPTIIGAEDLDPRAPARDPRPEPRVRHRHAARAARAPVRLAHAHRRRRGQQTAGTASAATRSPPASGSTPSRSTAAAASAAASPRPPRTCARAATSCSSRRAPAAPAPRATAPASPSSP